ncbi:hypothetical protein DPEC_G00167730 [Dallia pectoralis]|uniref:Uncharacterized protein n=1 Tax=Dallia pectoralis TaxID=75939 RepID=A0ACC2GIF9_DALPE|nr:hypothetical protein DPEC_G00167730 [Dallia pectoralis]
MENLDTVSLESNSDSGFLGHNEEEVRTEKLPADQTPRVLCRFYSQGRHCNYGRKCHFLHQRAESATLNQEKMENRTTTQSEQVSQRQTGPPSQPTEQHTVVGQRLLSKPRMSQTRGGGASQTRGGGASQTRGSGASQTRGGGASQTRGGGASQTTGGGASQTRGGVASQTTGGGASQTRGGGANNSRPCRYFLSGCCTMEDRCRYWHPPQFPPVEDKPMEDRVLPKPHPSALQVIKLSDLTDEVSRQLRDTEINQLMKRFPKEQLIVQERSDGKVTYYRVTVEPTDPDWPFDLKEIDILVCFPETYPQEVFTLDIPLDQDLPSVMGRYVEQASQEWLHAKHATNQLMGKVELLFRPFLRWLDRSMERLFTEGARQLKKDVEIAKCGIQFVPYQQLQVTVSKDHVTDQTADPVLNTTTDQEKTEEGDEEEWEDLGNSGSDEEEKEDRGKVENIKISEPRRGTEVKLLGLRLGEETATVVATHITVCLQCSRCKVTADLTLSSRKPCTAQCEKCNAGIKAAFRPSMLHAYSDILGYLDLGTASPVDLVLQDCELVVGCLNCSNEGPVQNLSYGQTKEFNCQHCHSKLSILVESTRFQYIKPREDKTGHKDSAGTYRRNIRDPAIQLGKALPEKGACKHYRQSHRWLRFPCCGRAYPCDVCHDINQDHSMELATRMICGHCCKEQSYSNGKSCISCGNMMTRGAFTSHWEGGLGCRSKVKMSRNDKHKYTNSNKTISRKATTEKK